MSLAMPEGASILSIQEQHGRITLWAKCPPGDSVEHRHFFIAGTGWDLPDGVLIFLETVQIEGLVWHIFEDLS